MIAGGAFPGKISGETATSIAVNLRPGYDGARTALEITLAAPGTYAVRSPRLLRTLAAQRAWLTQILFSALVIIWIVAVVLTAFIFSMIVDERRREMGLLRAAGATRNFIFRLILTESSFPAVAGGLAGIIIGGSFLFIFRTWLISALEMPVLFPSWSALVFLMAGSFILSLALVLPALLYPALRASRMDPAAAMRQG
jgi:putative ABC transport system permease protein